MSPSMYKTNSDSTFAFSSQWMTEAGMLYAL
jgi:hypothetical protein